MLKIITEFCKLLIPNHIKKDDYYIHMDFIFDTYQCVLANNKDNIQYWFLGVNSKEQDRV